MLEEHIASLWLVQMSGKQVCFTCLATSTPQWRPRYYFSWGNFSMRLVECNACGLRSAHGGHLCRICGFNMMRGEDQSFYCRFCDSGNPMPINYFHR